MKQSFDDKDELVRCMEENSNELELERELLGRMAEDSIKAGTLASDPAVFEQSQKVNAKILMAEQLQKMLDELEE